MFLRLLFLVLISFPVNAADYSSAIVKEVTSIYDADTFRVNIEGWPGIIGHRVPIRVLGVDAPELRGKCESEKVAARKAKQHTVALLRSARVIKLTGMKRGKYFRILSNVLVDGESLAESLISHGLARSYAGGKRESWC